MVKPKRNNHLVPKNYLSAWKNQAGKVWVYQLLVSHKDVDSWKDYPLKKTGMIRDFYINGIGENVCDKLEVRLEREIEAPAIRVLSKVRNNEVLAQTEWHKLLRYAFSLSVRTEKYYLDVMSMSREVFPKCLEEIITEISREGFTSQRNSGGPNSTEYSGLHPHNAVPINIKVMENKGSTTDLKITALATKNMYHYSIHRFIDNLEGSPFRFFESFRWIILQAPKNIMWPTSDNPVVKLGINADGSYRLNCHLIDPALQIIIPLSPFHVLYTRADNNHTWEKLSPASGDQSELITEAICKNANNAIFALERSSTYEEFQPRTVNKKAYNERKSWLNDMHSNYEEDLSSFPQGLID